MRKHFGHILMSVVLMLTAVALPAAEKSKAKSSSGKKSSGFAGFDVYTESRAPGNHFIPSGWMGDTADLLFSDAEANRPYSGRTCIKVTYRAKGGQGWAGIFWQNPANNWGTQPNAGFDLTGAKKLTFWARGEKGGEVLAEVKVGGITGEHPDSDEVATKNLVLTDQWAPYTLELNEANMNHVIGGFCVVFAKDANPEGATIYLDDITFSGK